VWTQNSLKCFLPAVWSYAAKGHSPCSSFTTHDGFSQPWLANSTFHLSVVPSNRTRGNGHKLKQRKLQLNMRKNFFLLRVTEHWHRLPREVVESPLEIFQTCLDAVLYSLLWVTLLRQGVGLGDPQRSLPTPTNLWFTKVWCDKIL